MIEHTREPALGENAPPERISGRELFRRLDAANGFMTREDSLAQAQHLIRDVVASRHDRPSLVAQIACEVGAEIVESRIQPGQDLNTVDLARSYSTSRTPVREALILLENEGLVDIAPRRRPRTHVHGIKEIIEIYRTRTALFELIASDFAMCAKPEDIAVLREVLDRMKKSAEIGDVTAYSWLNVEFHENDTRLSGNLTAKRIHDSLLLRTLACRRLSLSQPARMMKSLDDHVHLVAAYENHDSNLAGAIMRANHAGSLATIERYHARTVALEPLPASSPAEEPHGAGGETEPAGKA